MLLESLIARYGYLAIAVGTFLEGETILVLAGFAAHRGYLNLYGVMACAFLGSLLGDQLYFHLGRRKGQQLLDRHSEWQPRVRRVLAILERHQTLLILGFRFVYGMRTITPIILGSSRVSVRRFLLFNALGALAWAVAITLLGYLFGEAVQALLGDLRHIEEELFAGLAVIGLLVWGFHRWRRRTNNRRSKEKNS